MSELLQLSYLRCLDLPIWCWPGDGYVLLSAKLRLKNEKWGNNARNCAILAKNDRVSLCIHETTHQTLLYDELFSGSLDLANVTCLTSLGCNYLIPSEFGRRDWTRTNDPHHVKVVL